MHNYVATNIRLYGETLKALKIKAVEEGKSVSQLVREAVEQILKSGVQKIDRKEFENDSFFKIIGLGKSGIKDGSINHDRYLYGAKAER